MQWWDWVLLSVGMITLLGCAWRFIAVNMTDKKRLQLIDRCKISGDYNLALEEFDDVSFDEHVNAKFFFRNPRKLYGPLMQGVWDSDVQKAYHDFWWKCYNELYRNALKPTRRNINKYISTYGLTHALELNGYDLDYLLNEEPPKFSMVDGAEEYEQIMAMQEMGL